jgi:hypothetical protein
MIDCSNKLTSAIEKRGQLRPAAIPWRRGRLLEQRSFAGYIKTRLDFSLTFIPLHFFVDRDVLMPNDTFTQFK